MGISQEQLVRAACECPVKVKALSGGSGRENGPHLPWKLLSTSICPGTLQTVFNMVCVASGYCTLTLFFLKWTQVSLSPLAPCGALGAHHCLHRRQPRTYPGCPSYPVRKWREKDKASIGIWGIPKHPM